MSAVWNPLSGKTVRIVSSEDALRDVIPPAWGEDVLSGERKVVVSKETSEENNGKGDGSNE